MDYTGILALISFLTGNAEDGFSSLKVATAGNAPITQIVCPRPLPVNEIEGKTVFCGTVQVPEDHASPDGRKISLEFAILKSHSLYPESDPLVYLQGGPGASAMVQIPLLAGAFEPWRKTRDVIFWDQRSAGLSGQSVKCFNALASNAAKIAKKEYTTTAIDGSNESNNTIADCLREIEAAGIDISKYNTTENAKDVSTIIQALGYTSYNMYGVSYGTKLALETMRVAPEGIRAVIIDGVAPSWVKLYDTFAQKVSEPIEHVVEQCKADETCNATFPELDKVIIETLHAAKAGKVIHQGKPIEPKTIFRPFEERNAKYGNLSMTPYLPAFIYELHRGKEMPTVDLLVGRDFVMPMPGDDDVAKASATLPKAQRALIGTLADNAVISARIDRSNQNVVEELRDEIDAEKNYGRVATLFDSELEKALIAARGSDDAKAASMVADYAALQNINASKEALVTFVKTHTSGEASTRLAALIDSMSEAEVAGYFAIIQRDIAKSEEAFFGDLYLFNYACQEDLPFNSFEGYQKFTAAQEYPYIGDDADEAARFVFGSCIPFKQVQRDNWQVPVKSDIPTLSIGSLYDSQTPASWAKVATEELTNAQVFMIPEAGHGALLYQPCVADMGVAFINQPGRKLSNDCAESIKIEWHIPDWAKAAK
ncbi:alpha/beta hydrolase [Rhizobium sp. TH135]|uniref:alpha/beta hydrolase n=1 Tax=Rhizobium sp. TH135 TaxID=2067451 RepID=UPI001559297D|nr:alpha/beta hydrolase [Rhizobium sp. TH135]